MADLTLVRGTTGIIRTTVSPASLVLASDIYFMAKRHSVDLDEDAILSKSNAVDGGITVTDEDAGEIAITINPTDTRGLDNHRLLLRYEVEIEKDAAIYSVDVGTLTITPEIIQRDIA